MRFQRGSVRLPTKRNAGRDGTSAQPDHVAETIEEIVQFEGREHVDMGASDHVASKVTAFSGSMLYVWLHVVWFSIWILINVASLIFEPFDAYPFGLLTMIVSLEAIFLSTFVLISQNRQAIQADRRAKVDLQVHMITEREVTKVMDMISHIHKHLGIKPADDQELSDMQEKMHVGKLADAVDAAEREHDPEGAENPESAVDTE
jgi:uncharacterized membrane protein